MTSSNSCPFCGYKYTSINSKNLTRSDRRYQGERIRFYVTCRRCYARGPYSASEEDAMKAWNVAHMQGETTLHLRECNRIYCTR